MEVDKQLPKVYIYVKNIQCIPILGTEFSAGLDIKADISTLGTINIKGHSKAIISTGLKIVLPEKYKLGVFCKSGLATKRGIWIKYKIYSYHESPEVDLKVEVINGSSINFEVKHGQVIAQIIIAEFKSIPHTTEDNLQTIDYMNVQPLTPVLVPVKYDYHMYSKKQFGILKHNTALFDNIFIFPGVIDSDYSGQLHVVCMNESDVPIILRKGDIIAVMKRFEVVDYKNLLEIRMDITDNQCASSCCKVPLRIVRKERGSGGFGSTYKIEGHIINDCVKFSTLANNDGRSELFSLI